MAKTKIRIKNTSTGRSYEITERGWDEIRKNEAVAALYQVIETAPTVREEPVEEQKA